VGSFISYQYLNFRNGFADLIDGGFEEAPDDVSVRYLSLHTRSTGMLENESSMPYLLGGTMTVGTAVLLVGVALGSELVHSEQLTQFGQPLQLAGGAVLVLGVLLFARYLDGLADQEGGH
jgi:hypothetical protein